jgi:carbon monoxide dehydrogenase subunit G
MKIEKSFDIARSRNAVWEAFGDVHLVAACLPGSSIAEDLGNGQYKGKFSIKLGPMAAAFAGDVAIERKPEDWTAIVSGKGADPRSSSRANGSMTYRLSGGEGGQPTHVEVVSEINLAGALAQFGKAGVIQEIAGRLTNEFVRNFEAKLSPSAPQPGTDRASDTAPAGDASASPSASASASPAQSLDAGNLIWSILKDRMLGLFRRLTGRAA